MADYRTDRCMTTRRDFLRLAGAAIGTSCLQAPLKADESKEPPLHVEPGQAPTRVTRATFPHAVVQTTVHEPICREMLSQSLRRLMRTDTPTQAWRKLLKSNDIIGIKFNRSGQEQLATSLVLGKLIVQSIIEAGWREEQIVLIEPPPALPLLFETRAPLEGFEEYETDFGSGKDNLTRIMGQITALINVPFLKTHNIAGMSGCLKNLSHGLIKHPARFHDNGCNPYVADIVALPQIRNKLRLCIVDALRVVFKDGPIPNDDNVEIANTLLLTQDPVAGDSIGLTLLNGIRKKHRLSRLPDHVEYLLQLATAHRKGLGMAVLRSIDVEQILP